MFEFLHGGEDDAQHFFDVGSVDQLGIEMCSRWSLVSPVWVCGCVGVGDFPVLRVASGQEVAADKLLSGLIPGKTYGPKRVVGDDIAHDEGFGDIG